MFEDVRAYPLLSADECRRVAATVHDLKSYWKQRHPEVPFFTLGIASYLDAQQEAERGYHAAAYDMNTLLAARFSWLYRRLLDGLTQLLQEKVVYRPSCALPGFHVGLWCPASESWEASVHQDLQYELLDWSPTEQPDFHRPLSFTLAITLPQHGGGLNVWDVCHDELEGLSPDERHRKIMAARVEYHPYQVGHLVLHSGHKVHQIARTKKEQDGDERVTLQGHGIHCDGMWQLYW
ncbi:MAG: hypothetical protein AB7K24_09545 [Gemmataceae bacterium]